MTIGRREFITLLGGTAAAWPIAARAQKPEKLPTIGILGSATPAAQGQLYAVLVERLRTLGWIDGRTVAIEYRWAEGRDERYARPGDAELGLNSSSSWTFAFRMEPIWNLLQRDYRRRAK